VFPCIIDLEVCDVVNGYPEIKSIQRNSMRDQYNTQRSRRNDKTRIKVNLGFNSTIISILIEKDNFLNNNIEFEAVYSNNCES